MLFRSNPDALLPDIELFPGNSVWGLYDDNVEGIQETWDFETVQQELTDGINIGSSQSDQGGQDAVYDKPIFHPLLNGV